MSDSTSTLSRVVLSFVAGAAGGVIGLLGGAAVGHLAGINMGIAVFGGGLLLGTAAMIWTMVSYGRSAPKDGPGRFRVIGVERSTGKDTAAIIDATTIANATGGRGRQAHRHRREGRDDARGCRRNARRARVGP
jgi:hypothetical protein